MTFFPKQISQLMKRFIYWRCTAEIILKYRKKKKKKAGYEALFPMIITKAYSDLRLSPYFLIQLWLFNLIAVLGKPKRPKRLPDGLLVIVCNKYPFRMVLTFPTGWANPQMCFKLFNTLLKKKKKKRSYLNQMEPLIRRVSVRLIHTVADLQRLLTYK